MSLPPSGEIPQGAIRFNTDSQRLEFYAQDQWWVLSSDTPNLGRGVDSTPGVRGIVAAGGESPFHDDISYYNIATCGNSVDFGLYDGDRFCGGSAASRTRGIFAGAASPTRVNIIEKITISSTGNSTDFGTLQEKKGQLAGMSSETRGVFAGGSRSPDPLSTKLEYITIASDANALDFGSIGTGTEQSAGTQSPTRGIFAGGIQPGAVQQISFITLATLGDSQDFGDLINSGNMLGCGAGNATRGVFMGGESQTNLIQYITISTLGNATNFGDLTDGRNDVATGSSPTRAVCIGGLTPSSTQIMDYITISTTGNATDFGTSNKVFRTSFGLSNGHGGL